MTEILDVFNVGFIFIMFTFNTECRRPSNEDLNYCQIAVKKNQKVSKK